MELMNMPLLALPEGLAVIIAIYILINEKPEHAGIKFVLFACLYAPFGIISAYIAARYPEFNFIRQMALALFLMIILRILLTGSWNRAVLIASIFLLLLTMVSLVECGLEVLFTGNYSNYYDTPVEYLPIFWWPVDILLVAIVYWVHRSGAGKVFEKISHLDGEQTLLSVSLLFIFQFSVVTGALISFSIVHNTDSNPLSTGDYIVALCFLAFFASSISIIGYTINLAEEIATQAYEKQLTSQLQSITLDVKANRHDFVHHVQVLDILFQDGNMDEFRSYLSRIDEKMRASSQIASSTQSLLDNINALDETKRGHEKVTVIPIG